jgi:ABC-type phosphate/phosphonate transport system substrate-binding protein
MSKRTPILPAIVLCSAMAVAAATSPVTLVICAPGYPGTTKEAQPSMDVLAAAASKAAGWPPARVAAEYHEAEDAGVARLKAATPSVAMVPLPFFLAHQKELKLTAHAQAVEKDGSANVTWTLVAKKGRVRGPASLSGFTIVSLASYAPDFIRNVALAKWGELPANVTFAESGQILSALKKSANGDDVAVLLDVAQTKSLPTLPFAGDLEIVATSPPVPGIVLCTVGTSVGPTALGQLTAGLLKLNQSPEGAAALDAVRLAKFVPLDSKGLAAARASYAPPAKTAAR